MATHQEAGIMGSGGKEYIPHFIKHSRFPKKEVATNHNLQIKVLGVILDKSLSPESHLIGMEKSISQYPNVLCLINCFPTDLLDCPPTSAV